MHMLEYVNITCIDAVKMPGPLKLLFGGNIIHYSAVRLVHSLG